MNESTADVLRACVKQLSAWACCLLFGIQALPTTQASVVQIGPGQGPDTFISHALGQVFRAPPRATHLISITYWASGDPPPFPLSAVDLYQTDGIAAGFGLQLFRSPLPPISKTDISEIKITYPGAGFPVTAGLNYFALLSGPTFVTSIWDKDIIQGFPIYWVGPGGTYAAGDEWDISFIAVFRLPDPEISVVPASLSFSDASVPVGQSLTRSVTISNTGGADLVISNVRVDGLHASQFSAAPLNNVLLPPQGSVTVDVIFSPTSLGTKSATLMISHNAPDPNPLGVALQGGQAIVPPPETVEVVIESPAEDSSFQVGARILVSGIAKVCCAPSRIRSVTINGKLADVLDATGRFFAEVVVNGGDNKFDALGSSSGGVTGEVSVIVRGTSESSTTTDFSELAACRT